MTVISQRIRSRARDLGGFGVRRVLPAAEAQMVGPFVFVDHMGPERLPAGGGVDVRPHPHIGLATVTFLFEGELVHRDSLGTVQRIRPGDVNWMVAGRGIAHSERTPEELRPAGPVLHGMQTWVALPKAHEATEPSFAHHPASTIPVIERRGARIHVIAGRAFGERSPVAVFSDTLYAAVELQAGAALELPPEHEERGAYVVAGEVAVGGENLAPGELAVLAPVAAIPVCARERSTLMLLGGARMDGPRFIWWNFVASSREAIERAKADWRAGRFAPVPGETEGIPLPEA
ncbi:MAG: pirin family protein [Burkholderiales bacterium]|nr:pirin family protein [Burkholderiales bacterium]